MRKTTLSNFFNFTTVDQHEAAEQLFVYLMGQFISDQLKGIKGASSVGVTSVRGKSVKNIGDRYDFRVKVHFIPGQAVGVATSILIFMVL